MTSWTGTLAAAIGCQLSAPMEQIWRQTLPRNRSWGGFSESLGNEASLCDLLELRKRQVSFHHLDCLTASAGLHQKGQLLQDVGMFVVSLQMVLESGTSVVYKGQRGFLDP